MHTAMIPKGYRPTRVILEPHGTVISKVHGGIYIESEGVYVTSLVGEKSVMTLYPWIKIRRVEFQAVLNDQKKEA